MRVAVVDLGTNTTRLLVAEVADGALSELDKQTTITRLGQGVDATGQLADEAMDRVRDALTRYREIMDREGVTETIAVATSAMRDASNGPAFRDELNERFGIDARTISGDEEARLTFLGATSGRTPAAERPSETVVIDIGGGSTEYVIGSPNSAPDYHVSTQMGSVRHSERFLKSDPPEHDELVALAEDVWRVIEGHVPEEHRRRTAEGIAVAGTATTLAAIDQELDPYDPEKVHGYRVSLAAAERIQAMLAALPLEERREVIGLHPDRAPTIVAGVTILVESIRAFGLNEIEVSEADILHGAAMAAADGSARG
jgi:exopolyphosphatase / guanosine-5'-triphosphate,3'-diphosphate pyrophosphatase